MEQQGKGWLSDHFPLASSGDPFTSRDSSLNIAFRFGVEQSEKIRACDYLRHSLTNIACVVLAPINRASWGRHAEIPRLLNRGSREWGFFKADRESPYKKIPLGENHVRLAVIALWRPIDGQWYGFFSRTVMFGAISAVLHYNLFFSPPRWAGEQAFRNPLNLLL